MKELKTCELELVSGGNGPAIDPANKKILKDIAIDAGLGALTTPLTPWVGAGYGAAASVIHSAINNGPVNVPVPVLVGPSWNGSVPTGININGRKCPNGYRENPNGSCSP